MYKEWLRGDCKLFLGFDWEIWGMGFRGYTPKGERKFFFEVHLGPVQFYIHNFEKLPKWQEA